MLIRPFAMSGTAASASEKVPQPVHEQLGGDRLAHAVVVLGPEMGYRHCNRCDLAHGSSVGAGGPRGTYTKV
jgi:hypothetical protein